MKSLNWCFASVIALWALSLPAFAAKKIVKNAENKMMSACQKDFPDAVKGKSFKEVAEWVETEERGANADTFKKTGCYTLHEDWEKVAAKNEAGEADHK